MRKFRNLIVIVAAAMSLAACTICKNADHKGSIYGSPDLSSGHTDMQQR